jgi:hypothetical protein
MNFKDIVREAEAKEHARLKKLANNKRARSRTPARTDPKKDKRPNGAPTTQALRLWKSGEFAEVFQDQAARVVRRYNPGPKVKELSLMKRFLEALDVKQACPRSKLLIVEEAARRLIRYRRKFNVKAQPGTWMLVRYGEEIIDDLKHLLYGEDSLRYVYSEEIPVDMLDIEETDDGWEISWNDHRARLPKSHATQISNPHLLTRLGKPQTAEERPDNEDYANW